MLAGGDLAAMPVLWGVSLVCGLAYPVLPAAWRDLRSLVKTAAIAALAGVALAQGAAGLAVALALSALGDLALSRSGDRAFLLGMGAFGAAHLAYLGVFAGFGAVGFLLAPTRFAAAVGLVALACLVGFRLSRGAGAFRWPLRLYVTVIAAMGLAALSLPMGGHAALIIAGAAAFIASDLLIGHERFAGWHAPGLALAIWGLYYVGQVLILVGGLGLGAALATLAA